MRSLEIKPVRVAQNDYGKRSSGEPLPASTRAFAESHFEHDFSRVRVHTDARAAAAASSLGAQAFTKNHDIVFAAGQYAPNTQAGRRLLSHELTHVVQQQSGIALKDGMGQAGDSYEAHADRVAERVSQGLHARPLLDQIPGGAMENSAPGLQMRKQGGSPSQNNTTAEDPKLEALRAAFQKQLQEDKAREEINRPLALAIAHAYVTRTKALQATQYTDDRVQPGPVNEPSETAVYQAIVGALDVRATGKGKNVMEWSWRPVHDPNAGKRDGAAKEITSWGVKELIGGTNLKDVALSQKDNAIKYSAKWLLGRGFTATAMVLSGAGELMAAFELAFSLAEILNILQKPLKRQPYKNEIILRDVMQWLAGEQAKLAAAENAKDAGTQESAVPSIQIMVPDKLRVGR